MANAQVQKKTMPGADAPATTVALAFDSPPAAGSLLVAVVFWNHTGTEAASGVATPNDAFAQDTTIYSSGIAQNLALWSVPNCVGGANSQTITATFAAGRAFRKLTIFEYSGAATAAATDDTAGAADVGSPTPAIPDPGTITPTVDGELIISAAGTDTAAPTPSAAAGFGSEEADTGYLFSVASQIQTTATERTAFWTAPSDTANWAAVAASYKAAAGAGPATGDDSAALTEATALLDAVPDSLTTTLSEATALLDTLGVTDSVSLTDTASIVDVGADAADSDSASLTDTAVAVAGDVSPADSIALTEAAASAETMAVTDSGTLTDTAAVVDSGEAVTGTDSITLTEIEVELADATTAADVTLSEAVSLAETEAVSDSASVTEVVGLVDTWAVTDSAALTEAAVIVDTGESIVTDTDSAVFAEAVDALLDSLGVTDAGTLSEAAESAEVYAGIGETATLGEAVAILDSLVTSETFTLTESGALTDYAGQVSGTATLSPRLAGTATLGV